MLLVVPLSHLALVTPPRRAVLRDAAAAAALALPWLPPHAALAAKLNPEGVASETRALDQAPVVDPGRFRKLDSGVRVADLKQGSGPEVGDGSRVALQWVLRRSNGYFVDSSLGALASGPGGGTLSLGGDASEDFTPFLFTVGDGKALRGIEDGVRGMRQGGVRRLRAAAEDGDGARVHAADRQVGGPAARRLRPAAAARARAREAGPVQLLHVRGRGGAVK